MQGETYVDVLPRFAEIMKSQFEINAHKGSGAEPVPRELRPMLDIAQEKLETLRAVIRSGQAPIKILTEAADLANMALIVAENYERRYPNV